MGWYYGTAADLLAHQQQSEHIVTLAPVHTQPPRPPTGTYTLANSGRPCRTAWEGSASDIGMLLGEDSRLARGSEVTDPQIPDLLSCSPACATYRS